MIAALSPTRRAPVSGGWSSARNRSRTDALNDAHAFAYSLATTLMIAIVIFRAGDGTLSVIPYNEFDGDAEIVAEIDPFAL